MVISYMYIILFYFATIKMASYQQQKQIELSFAGISSPAIRGSDTLGTLQLIKKLGVGTPAVKAAFEKILDDETRFMGAAALAVANNSAFSSKVGSCMAGVLSLTELFKQRAETRVANSLIDASLDSLASTSLVETLKDMKSGNKAIRDLPDL